MHIISTERFRVKGFAQGIWTYDLPTSPTSWATTALKWLLLKVMLCSQKYVYMCTCSWYLYVLVEHPFQKLSFWVSPYCVALVRRLKCRFGIWFKIVFVIYRTVHSKTCTEILFDCSCHKNRISENKHSKTYKYMNVDCMVEHYHSCEWSAAVPMCATVVQKVYSTCSAKRALVGQPQEHQTWVVIWGQMRMPGL